MFFIIPMTVVSFFCT